MKIDRLQDDALLLVIAPWEKQLLDTLLKLSSLLQGMPANLSRGGGLPEQASAQTMLEESLRESRLAGQQIVARWLEDPQRLRPIADSEAFSMRISLVEAETFLQVLNDIRVSSWVALGCPQQRLTKLTEENAPHVWAMELCGVFQSELLEALHPL